jgi:hypothetical protein
MWWLGRMAGRRAGTPFLRPAAAAMGLPFLPDPGGRAFRFLAAAVLAVPRSSCSSLLCCAGRPEVSVPLLRLSAGRLWGPEGAHLRKYWKAQDRGFMSLQLTPGSRQTSCTV